MKKFEVTFMFSEMQLYIQESKDAQTAIDEVKKQMQNGILPDDTDTSLDFYECREV